MSKNLVSHRRAIQMLFKEEQLQNILHMADEISKSEAGNIEFLEYQRQILQKVFPGFSYEFCISSTVVSDENMVAQEIECVLLDLPDEILLSYMNNAEYDDLTPLSLLNPGRALNYTQVFQDKTVKEHPFFTNHCSKFGIHKGITVGYIYPASKHTFITFDYLGDENNDAWNKFDHSRLGIASFPFALVWLCRQRRMDKAELTRCFDLLGGFSESTIQNLRKFITTPHLTFSEQGSDLGMQGNSLRADLNKTLKRVAPRLVKYCRPEEVSSTKRLAGLKLHYDFLKMCGDHTQELVPLP